MLEEDSMIEDRFIGFSNINSCEKCGFEINYCECMEELYD
jgi:hypothetical protein